MALSMSLKTILSKIFKTEDTGVVETPEFYLRLIAKSLEQADRMTKVSTSPKFNYEQCIYLADKLKLSVQSAHSFFEQINTENSTLPSADNKPRPLEIFKLLFALGKEVESFIQDCSKDAWIQSAILLTNVTELISTIAFNLELCTIVFSNRKTIAAIPTSLTKTEVARLRQAQAEIVREKANLDKLRLSKDLSALIQSNESSSVEWQLATFLLARLRSPRQHLGPDLAGSNQFSCPEILVSSLKQLDRLGKGASGTVHKAMWLGTQVAKKTFHGPGNPDFLQEVLILGELCHPNIVSLLWHMMDLRKCYIIMELMDGDLYSLMQERLEEQELHSFPFTIWETINIILQVAEGMLFLHENKIVHRDLKSSNILVRYVKATEVDVQYVQVKVADFGLSKTKEKSMTYSNQTPNMGTTRWMAPEVMKITNQDGEVELLEGDLTLKHPFKSDVYSFGMVCYEILTGSVPFQDICRPYEVKKKVLAGGCPQLPHHCPQKLRTLIEACWNSEPSRRPRFGDICAELRHLKCAHFMTSAWGRYSPRYFSGPCCFSLDEIRRMTNNFNNDNMLQGCRERTKVYKGVRDDTGEVVAVERVSPQESFLRLFQASRKLEFNTLVDVLSGLHHNNLMALLGFCVEKDVLYLVYEYMAKGSLDQHLHPRNLDGSVTMDWKARMKCAAEVAQGLEYLHSHAEPSLVHLNVHSRNILFDEEMQAKIADFGSSKLLPSGHQPIVSDWLSGTHGYVDPVYLINGVSCDKNDVYSYGVVLLELITGRRAIQNWVSLVMWCKDYFFGKTLVTEMVDKRINRSEYSEDELYGVIKVAYMCVADRQENRPSMKDVVVWLHNANSSSNSKDHSSSESSSLETTLDFTTINGSNHSPFTDHLHYQPQTQPLMFARTSSGLSSYEIRDGTILVKCTVGNNRKIALRCKIWPTLENFGLNKIEATQNGALLWKKGLWWHNAKSSREFSIDDEIDLTAEWHVTLRVPTVLNKHSLPSHDPRRHQGPFCVKYLALKENGHVLVEYLGDRMPLPETSSSAEHRPIRENQPINNYPIRIIRTRSGTGAGPSSARRHSINTRRAMNARHSTTAH